MMVGSRTERRSLRTCQSPLSFTARLREETECYRSDNSFVPFVRERNSTGKLIRTGRDTPERLACTPVKLLTMRRSAGDHRRSHTPRLKRLLIKLDTPGVGTYAIESQWIQKSFSVRKTSPSTCTHSPTPTAISSVARPPSLSQQTLTPTFQYTISPSKPRLHRPDKFAILRPEVAVKCMEKTNFQSMKLGDSPEALMAAFQFKERRRLKDEKLSVVKRFMRRMVKGKFF